MKFAATAKPHGDGWKIHGTIEPEESPVSPIGALAGWLRALDADEVERVALERCDGLNGSATADILEVLAEWAEGAVRAFP